MLLAARQSDSEREVVLKTTVTDTPSLEQFARWRREFETLHSLEGSATLEPVECVVVDNRPVLVLERFRGTCLQDVRPLEPAPFLRLALRLAEALDSLHRRGYVHQRLTPETILVNSDHTRVCLINLDQASRSPSLPSDQSFRASLSFIAPEQTGRVDKAVDFRTDLYALGGIFYQLLTGRPPYREEDQAALIHAQIARLPEPPDQVVPEVPPTVSQLVMKLLAKSQSERYQSCSGLQFDLTRCLEEWEKGGEISKFRPGQLDVSYRLEMPKRLYGRDSQLASLLSAFERARGGEVIWVQLRGNSGVGKSTLAEAARKNFIRQGGLFVTGKFQPYHQNRPYHALLESFGELALLLLGETEQGLKLWKKRILEAVHPNGALLTELAPLLGELLGPQPELPVLTPTESMNRFQLVVQDFLTAVATPEHPLVILLEDLHWADRPTLNILEVLLTNRLQRNLLVVGTFRDGEKEQTLPLHRLFKSLKEKSVTTFDIKVEPFNLDELTLLTGETLSSRPSKELELAKFLLERTGGNPFFVRQLLELLRESGKLRVADGLWDWEPEELRTVEMMDSVAEMMARRIKTLDSKTRDILGIAACVGSHFELDVLESITNYSRTEISEGLDRCAREGLLYFVVSDRRSQDLRQRYLFAHDQIQAAAYSLLNEVDRPRYHRTIGEHLLAKLEPEKRGDRIFEIVSHLNLGADQHSDTNSRLRLNIDAGQRALKAAAYSSALSYLLTALRLLGQEGWEGDYDLTLLVHIEAAEAAYLCADFETVARLTGEVVDRARDNLTIARIYDVKVQALMAERRLSEAVETGFHALALLGEEMPVQATPREVAEEFEAVQRAVPASRIEALGELQAMVCPQKLAAMKMLVTVFSSVYLSRPEYLPILACRQVRLSALHGNAPQSAYSYAAYGLLLCGPLSDLKTGYRYGTVALKLLESSDDVRMKARVWHVVMTFTRPWQDHLQTTLDPLLEAHRCGLVSGDFEYSAFAALVHCYYSYFSGMGLGEVEQKIEVFGPVIARTGQKTTYRYLRIWRRTVQDLRRRPVEPTDSQGEFSDPNLDALAGDRTALFFVYFTRMNLEYTYGRFHQAASSSKQAGRYLDGVTANVCSALYLFWDALIQLALFRIEGDPKMAASAGKQLSKLREFADHAPTNFLHKVTLVEAELARSENREGEALRLYEKAMEGAASNGYLHEEALAFELAAEFYEEMELPRLARYHFTQAVSRYARWGASGKVDHLQNQTVPPLPVNESSPAVPAMDLDSILKASQAISKELVLPELVSALLRISMENAGSDRALLLLQEEEELTVYAERSLRREDQVRFLSGVRYDSRKDDGSPYLPTSVVNFVKRTHEQIIESRGASRFDRDPYFDVCEPQSFLCGPLIHRGQLVGLLYLENHLTKNAFTTTRLEVLRLLSGHAAISIHNAQLFRNLEEAGRELERREQQLAHFLEAVPIGIFVTNDQGEPSYANSAAKAILGSGVEPGTPKEQLAEVYRIYLAGTNRLYPSERLPVALALQGESVRAEDLEVEVEGRRRRLAATGTPVTDEEGKIVFAIAVFEDITENKAAQALLEDYSRTLEAEVEERTSEVEQAKLVAEAASQAKSNFLANMSHEVRTPLNAVLGLTSLTLRSGPSPRIADYLRKVHSCSRSLLHIINDILDFSRIEAGQMKIDKIDFNLRELLESLNNVVGDEAHRKGLEFLVALDSNVPRGLHGDSYRIGQVLTNLVYNAVKFTHTGTVMVRASLQRDSGRPSIRFSVTDTGIGIEPEALPGLFESFTQVDASSTRKYGGAGLGLAICRNLVELMGGRLEAVSEPGRGSTFSFILELERQNEEITEPVLSPEYRGRKVLVVDDNRTVGGVLEELLSSMGLASVCAHDQKQALSALEEHTFSLILVDWKMPGEDSLETALSLSCQAPCYLMSTTYDQGELAELIRETDLSGLLAKPVCRHELFEVALEAFGAQAGTKTQDLDAWDLEGRLKGLKVLVAEDIELNRQIIRDVLELVGVEVVLVSDGHQAIEAVRAETFDAVLMDVQMPVMDGFEATAQLRLMGYDKLPIIAITARAMEGDLELCLKAGMDAHVTKPISVPEFLRVLAGQTVADDGAPAVAPGKALHRSLPMGNELERLKPHLQSFSRTHARLVDEVAAAIRKGEDPDQPLHKLVGLAGNLGLGSLHHAALELQTALRNNLDHLSHLNHLETSMSEALKAIADLDSAPRTRRRMTVREWTELEQLLRTKDFRASVLFDSLVGEVEGLEPLLASMDQLDFEGALTRLREMPLGSLSTE